MSETEKNMRRKSNRNQMATEIANKYSTLSVGVTENDNFHFSFLIVCGTDAIWNTVQAKGPSGKNWIEREKEKKKVVVARLLDF